MGTRIAVLCVLAACGSPAPVGSAQPFIPAPTTGAEASPASSPEVVEDAPEIALPEPEPTPDPAPAPEPMPPPPEGRILYPYGEVQSPLTPGITDRLRGLIAEKPRRNAFFSKVGASSTVSTSYLRCLATTPMSGSLETTRQFFLGDGDPYRRTSLCATSGWTASHALAGTPSPLTQELAAATPRFAQVHYGTNDIGWGDPDRFTDNMFRITDQMFEGGTIPWLSTILPNYDSASNNAWVPRYNAIIRAVAQRRGVPLLDVYEAASKLPGFGMASDGIHPKAAPTGACDFSASGLAYGHNTRNLITLELLDRYKRVLLDGEAAPDSPTPLLGDGTASSPFVVPSIPFAHAEDTRVATSRAIDAYSGCDADQNESGAEYFYRFTLTENRSVQISVFSRTGVDIDVHLLGEDATPAQCIARDHKSITRSLSPGTYYVVLDTFVSSNGTENAGEFVVSIL